MRGRFHLVASAPYLFAIGWSFDSIGLPYEMFSVLLLAMVIGSLLPDVDASDSVILRESSGTGQFLRYAVYYPAASLAEKFVGVKKKHRGIMHSLVGMFLFDLILLPLLYGLVVLYSILTHTAIAVFSLILPWLMTGGLTLGSAFHITEDSFTVSGVQWLLPRDHVTHGNLRTFSKQEERFSEFLFIMGLAPIYIAYYLKQIWPVIATTGVAFFIAYVGQRVLVHRDDEIPSSSSSSKRS